MLFQTFDFFTGTQNKISWRMCLPLQ